MKKEIILSYRKGPPAYFDLAGRIRPKGVSPYGIFRIGDRAVAHIMVGDWRVSHPDHELVVVVDEFPDAVKYSKDLPAHWLFDGWADQIWSTERFGEIPPCPPGESVCRYPYFAHWARFRKNKTFTPSIRPMPYALERAREVLDEMKVGPEFVTVQPLWDACYQRFRNELPVWWMRVVGDLAGLMPVVVLGLPSNFKFVDCPAAAFPAYKYSLNVMESLAVISLAKEHIGGETGTTLWAPMLGVPTLALYRNWFSSGSHMDVCPISFGNPVVWGRLGSDVREIVKQAAVLVRTPVEDVLSC